jgi:hypothetical protein
LSSKDSLISTNTTTFPLAKRGQSPQKLDDRRLGSHRLPRVPALRGSGTSTAPVLGSMVQRGLISKEHP